MGIVLAFAGAAPVAAQWEWTGRLRLGAGDESDLVVDPSLTGAIVPAGGFAEVAPSVAGSRWLSARGRLDLGASVSFQSYLQEERRRLLGQSASADLRWGLGDRWLGRISSSIDFYDDSERPTVRRFGVGGELGLTWLQETTSVELWAGGRGRRYPDLELLTVDGTTESYAEGAVSGGVDARLRLTTALRVHAQVAIQGTDARDDDFDARAVILSAGADLYAHPELRMTAFASRQERRFTARTTADDEDVYSQAGLGVEWSPSHRWSLGLRAALARYEWPDGSEEDNHRLAVFFTRTWGRSGLLEWSREPGWDELPAIQTPDPSGRIELRLLAPDAAVVQVAGDFNEWRPDGHALSRGNDGWWSISLSVAPGTYEYAYRVDGEWVTPPEALITVDDGFGGRNGLLEILESEAAGS